MTAEQRAALVTRNTAEVVTAAELQSLLDRGGAPKAYIGFEPSGFVHVANGFVCGAKVADLAAAGFEVTILLADWHAMINDKFGGDLAAIRECGRYFEDAFRALGVPPSVRFRTASELVAQADYWADVLRVSKRSTLARIRRAMTIMGRKESDADQDAAKLVYPAMQVTDIHRLDVEVAYGGMDQRHAHMLYRDLVPKLGWKSVVAVHTPLLSSLKGGGRMDSPDSKMSKSDPNSAIFLHDGPAAVFRKVERAVCPPKVVEGNPIADFARWIVLPRLGALRVERPTKFGGDVEYHDWPLLEKDYVEGKLHPADLKKAVGAALNQLLVPVHRYFATKRDTLDRMQALTGLSFDS